MEILITNIELDKLIPQIELYDNELALQCSKFKKIDNASNSKWERDKYNYLISIDFDIEKLGLFSKDCYNKYHYSYGKKIKNSKIDHASYFDLYYLFDQIRYSLEIGKSITILEYIYFKLHPYLNNYVHQICLDERGEKYIEIGFNKYLKVLFYDEGTSFTLHMYEESMTVGTHWHPFNVDESIIDLIDIIEGKYVFVIDYKAGMYNGMKVLEANEDINEISRFLNKKRVAVTSSLGIIKEVNEEGFVQTTEDMGDICYELKECPNIGDKLVLSYDQHGVSYFEFNFNKYLYFMGDSSLIDNNLTHIHFNSDEEFKRFILDVANGNIIFIENTCWFSIKRFSPFQPWNLKMINKNRFEKKKSKLLKNKWLRIYTGNEIIKESFKDI